MDSHGNFVVVIGPAIKGAVPRLSRQHSKVQPLEGYDSSIHDGAYIEVASGEDDGGAFLSRIKMKDIKSLFPGLQKLEWLEKKYIRIIFKHFAAETIQSIIAWGLSTEKHLTVPVRDMWKEISAHLPGPVDKEELPEPVQNKGVCDATSLSWYLPYDNRLWWEDKVVARWLEIYRFAKVHRKASLATAAVLSTQRFVQHHDHHVTPPIITRIHEVFGTDDPMYEFWVDCYAFTGLFSEYSFPEEMPISFLLKVMDKRGPTTDRYAENGQRLTGHVDEDPANHNMTWCYYHGHTSHRKRKACEKARDYDFDVCVQNGKGYTEWYDKQKEAHQNSRFY